MKDEMENIDKQEPSDKQDNSDKQSSNKQEPSDKQDPSDTKSDDDKQESSDKQDNSDKQSSNKQDPSDTKSDDDISILWALIPGLIAFIVGCVLIYICISSDKCEMENPIFYLLVSIVVGFSVAISGYKWGLFVEGKIPWYFIFYT